ncbi:hypothetical protein FNF31_06430 [Cafeteria roenbergensis]|uniref:Uncharacterized protein n=1 Tax=Cafeteria roenbergensis TaxID=33653 RepID=A0A5A8CMI2_CAFRO|nr:hypothetical protein FNF31_06430 [Cafeteria roenbergensis]
MQGSRTSCACLALAVAGLAVRAYGTVVQAPHVHRASADVPAHEDGGAGALPPDPGQPDSAPGFESDFVATSTLLPLVAKHFATSLVVTPRDTEREALLPPRRQAVSRWSHYWRVYEPLLEKLRHKQGAVVVEVGTFLGGSAQIWAEWFGPEVQVHAIDIHDMSRVVEPFGVRSWTADQSNASFWRDEFFPEVGHIDALIDDGGHTWAQQVVTVREALPWVKPGGVLAVEDTHSSFMSGFCGTTHESETVLGPAPHVHRASADVPAHEDGGAGALPPDPGQPDSAPGFESDFVATSTLLPLVAKHFATSLVVTPRDTEREALLPPRRQAVSRWSHYWRVYEPLLEKLRHKQGAVVVEVGTFLGGSAQIWAEWFGPEVQVHAIDIHDMSRVVEPFGVRSWTADQSNASFWRDEFFPEVGHIDALIDDGGHTWAQQVVTVREALPWVKPGGVLAVEDTHSSFMSGFCGTTHESETVLGPVREAVRGALSSGMSRETVESESSPVLPTDLLAAGLGSRPAIADDPSFAAIPQHLHDRATRSSSEASRAQLRRALVNDSLTQQPCGHAAGLPVARVPRFTFLDEARSLVGDLHAAWLVPSDSSIRSFGAAAAEASGGVALVPLLAVYEPLLEKLRHKQGAVVVEVGTFLGGSAQIWAEWFGPEVQVHAIDIHDMSRVVEPFGVRSWTADQSNASFWRDEFFPEVGHIDALIDDGGHTWAQQVVTVREALPWVKPGGVLAVEDTHSSFMSGFCGTTHESETVLGPAPHVHRASADVPAHEDGGAGALPPDPGQPDSAPGFERDFVATSTLLPLVAKHFATSLVVTPRDTEREALLPPRRQAVSRWSHYWRVYEPLLEKLRHKQGAVVVEVGTFLGGSAQIWAEWFGPEVQVHAIDIHDMSRVVEPFGVRSWTADQSNASFWRDEFFPEVGHIDALIDDGGHTWAQQVVTVREALPWVKPGGVLAVEDTHSSFMSGFCGTTHESETVLGPVREAVRGALSSGMSRETVESESSPVLPTDLLAAGLGSRPAIADDPSFAAIPQHLHDRATRSSSEASRAQLRRALVNDSLTQQPCGHAAGLPVARVPRFTFLDEARSLVGDLHAAWLEPSDELRQTVIQEAAEWQRLAAPRLELARSARGSLLGPAWRRWFTRHISSVQFHESIVLFHRWWAPEGRREPASFMAGTAMGRHRARGGITSTAGEDSPKYMAALADEEVLDSVGPHMRDLVEAVEAESLASLSGDGRRTVAEVLQSELDELRRMA